MEPLSFCEICGEPDKCECQYLTGACDHAKVRYVLEGEFIWRELHVAGMVLDRRQVCSIGDSREIGLLSVFIRSGGKLTYRK